LKKLVKEARHSSLPFFYKKIYYSRKGDIMNYLIYPIKIMNITQTYENDFSHSRHTVGTPKDYPIDDNCGESGANGYFYCPCDEVVVKKIYGVGTSSTNCLWLES